MKHIKKAIIILISAVFLLTCETDPLTGKTTMALVSDSELFLAATEQYNEFLNENTVIPKTDPRAAMVERLGISISDAANKWYNYIGEPHYLDSYKWEYNLVDSKEINAWCMPGGKIVVYTGILEVFKNKDGTINEDMFTTVMGHEVAHALLNHGKQRVSLNFLTQLGLAAASLTADAMGASDESKAVFLTALGVGSAVGVTLPFSRENESEADHYGLILMAIAGFDPEQSVPFWQKMDAMSGDSIEFLSTHPANKTRINDLRIKSIPEAKRKAAKLHLEALQKEAILRAKKIAAEVNNQ
jgi:predicted Zn-dependent protease